MDFEEGFKDDPKELLLLLEPLGFPPTVGLDGAEKDFEDGLLDIWAIGSLSYSMNRSSSSSNSSYASSCL